jgi:Holliday junction DNA helicase RuvA
MIQAEAVQALVALGYGNTESMKAVRKVSVDENKTVEEVLKLALKNMMF